MLKRPLRISLISERASPLASPGGIDAGGQNIYVAHLDVAHLARGLPAVKDAASRHVSRVDSPDVIHANVFISGYVGLRLRFGTMRVADSRPQQVSP